MTTLEGTPFLSIILLIQLILRYRWQTLKKGFKAYCYEKNRKLPPYKHDLIALAKDTGLLSELSQDWTGFLAEVSQCYFTARYPDKYKEITKIFDKKKSRGTLKPTGVIYKWLKKKLA
ncbi:MAG: HEPN domain-containing protein [Bacillota bacterium]